MPDTTLLRAVMPKSAAAQQNAFVSGAGRTKGGTKPGTGFDEVIDATAISIMGSSGIQVTNAGTNVTGETREWNAVNTTSMSAQVKSISKDTGAAAAGNGTDRTVRENAPDKGSLNKAVNEAGEQIVKETAERMDVTEGEVRQVLDELGLTEGQLLDQDNLAALLTAIAGEEGPEALITNAELYDTFAELTELGTELKEGLTESFDLTKDALNIAISSAEEPLAMAGEALLQEAEAGLNGQVTGQVTAEDGMMQEAEAVVSVEEAAEGSADEAEADVQTAETKAVNETAQTNEAAKTVEAGENEEVTAAQAEEGTDTVKKDVRVPEEEKSPEETADTEKAVEGRPFEKPVNPEETGSGQDNGGGRRDDPARTAQGNREVQSNRGSSDTNIVMNNILNSVNDTLQSLNETAQTSYTSGAQTVDAQDIMRQVVEQMRISFRADTTSMEMQLNPESLGRLNVVLSTMRNGDIVAQFTTANESVKAALDMQLPQLMQRFEEQGIKVNSVEVMVDQRAFDSHKDQSFANQDQRADQEAENRRIGRMRRVAVDLGSIDMDDIDSLSEEERGEVERMEAEGATVAYRA